jgi:hypothetical protein
MWVELLDTAHLYGEIRLKRNHMATSRKVLQRVPNDFEVFSMRHFCEAVWLGPPPNQTQLISVQKIFCLVVDPSLLN